MKRLFVFLLINYALAIQVQAQQKPMLYLIPGQGADYRLFLQLEIDSAYQVEYIHYRTPEKDWNMQNFARELSKQIDTTRQYSILGVSLGGMLATEMNEFLSPEKTIVVSSAKAPDELPGRYRFQKKIPVYKLVPKRIIKLGARILQPLVEPDRKNNKETFRSMLKDKEPEFFKQTVRIIMQWERSEYNPNIVHIHGDNDNTIPIKNVDPNYIVKDGSHMMVLTKASVVSEIVNKILDEAESE